MIAGFPLLRPGLTVGLLGGSFDPPHAAHVHITQEALRAFGLDRAWWLVSPGNPLKARGPAPIAARMEAARAIMQHPRVTVTDIECRLGTRVTAETLAALREVYPGVRFVWLMGADNLASLHHWQAWRWIIETVPIGVFARPGQQLSAGLSPAARLYHRRRLPPQAAPLLGRGGGPARWVLLTGPMSATSSSAIRGRGEWG